MSKWLQDLVGDFGVGWTDIPRQSTASLGLPWQATCDSERPYQEYVVELKHSLLMLRLSCVGHSSKLQTPGAAGIVWPLLFITNRYFQA